jgi:hypothetical protein
VDLVIKDKDRTAFVEALDKIVVLGVKNLEYRKPSQGLALRWRMLRKELPADQEPQTREQLMALVTLALSGVVAPADLKTLAAATTITFGDQQQQATEVAQWYYLTQCQPYWAPFGWYSFVGSDWSYWVPVPAVVVAAPAPQAVVAAREQPAAADAPVVASRPTLPKYDASHELRLPRENELVDDYPTDALACYTRGRLAYLRRDYGEARAYLTRAVQLDDRDARFWYFKALAELAMDQPKRAVASGTRGKDLQARGLPAAEQIQLALDRVPEAARQFLASVNALPSMTIPVAANR